MPLGLDTRQPSRAASVASVASSLTEAELGCFIAYNAFSPSPLLFSFWVDLSYLWQFASRSSFCSEWRLLDCLDPTGRLSLVRGRMRLTRPAVGL